MLDRAKQNPKIKFLLPYTVERPLADNQGLTGIQIKNVASNEVTDLAVDGLFMAIGHTPNSTLFLPWVDIDEHDYIKVTRGVCTKTAGVFAAGDIADPIFKQAITASGMGCQAAILAARYIEENFH
jgi:thioredoxin reductase (NADPH)